MKKFMDMGTGKTKVCLNTKRNNLAIIVAPKGVIANWVEEIEAYLPDRIKRRNIKTEK